MKYNNGGSHPRFTFEYVKKYFEDQKCELLEDQYINSSTKMQYKCECGNIAYITFDCFKNRNRRCRKCSGTELLTYEYVYNFFKEQGCELLETEIVKFNEKMKYRCSCGNISTTLFQNFKRGHRCKKCGKNEIASYQEVFDYFQKFGYQLLEKEYVNSTVKMKCKCNHGHEFYIDFSHFKTGNRCIVCHASKGEKRIWGYLYRNKFNFIYQYSFEDCKNIDKLYFDFAVFDDNKNLQYLIEYDGAQHYKKVSLFSNGNTFEITKINDEIKNKYCQDNNINLIRIPYTKTDDIEMILYELFLSQNNQTSPEQENQQKVVNQ